MVINPEGVAIRAFQFGITIQAKEILLSDGRLHIVVIVEGLAPYPLFSGRTVPGLITWANGARGVADDGFEGEVVSGFDIYQKSFFLHCEHTWTDFPQSQFI